MQHYGIGRLGERCNLLESRIGDCEQKMARVYPLLGKVAGLEKKIQALENKNKHLMSRIVHLEKTARTTPFKNSRRAIWLLFAAVLATGAIMLLGCWNQVKAELTKSRSEPKSA